MKNPTYEQALTKQGVTFAYLPKVNLDSIDAKRSIHNQARLELPLDEGLVESYAAVAKDGGEFPPLVAWKPGAKSKFVLIDGNQRFAAFRKAGKDHHDAYAVDCVDPQVIDRLTWNFNNLVNGKRLSSDESLEHAATFVRKYGTELRASAKEWGIPEWKLKRRLDVLRVRDALDRQNVHTPPNMTEDKIHRLTVLLSAGEDVVARVAEVAGKAGLGAEEVSDLVKDVSHGKTTAERLRMIDDFSGSSRARARMAETKNGKVIAKGPLPRERLVSLLSQTQRLLEDYPEKEAMRPPTKEEFTRVRKMVEEVTNRLVVVFMLGAKVQAKEAI